MEENSDDDQIYMPEVVDERKPKIGMEFGSVDEAFLFYNHYAREAGFSTRINTSKKYKITNEVVWKQFVCSKEGHTDEKKNQPSDEKRRKERARGQVRTGFRSKISIVKAQSGTNWAVSAFQESHNHPLSTPSKVHLLQSHRTVSAAKKALTQQFSEANVSTCQQIRLLEIEYGGSEHIGCTETDIRNFERDLKNEQKDIDAETLIEFFASEKEKNSDFFFIYETYSEKRLNRCFWADAVSRRTYSAFGDVVVDEKTESFVWMLNKFVEAMPTGAPNVIITDQDPAMTKAIAQVFPQTMHRYCLWYILNKFSEKLDPMTFRDHYQIIKHVIENSTTPNEFVSSWEEAMKCAKLEGNDWLQLMYDLRKKWVPAYLNHVFAAGMSSSQISESSHSFFKRSKEICQWNIRWLKCIQKKKWVEFESEISESHGYCVQQVSEEDEKVIYNVMHYQSSSSSKPKVFQLPDKYILNRWTQHAMVGAPYTMGEENISNDPEKLLISRNSRLSFKSSLIIDETSLTDEGTKLMEEQLDSLYYKIREINNSRNLSMGR
ncbi:protein FAR1-RELATED SEQUENCE 5-like [Henckelia pumila]|uniref:protein FAR1-RELATED SEQUENCE 5-like n=1 Tax=Henckelia pumila TaxID=405737 RepID=UPI003C6E3253